MKCSPTPADDHGYDWTQRWLNDSRPAFPGMAGEIQRPAWTPLAVCHAKCCCYPGSDFADSLRSLSLQWCKMKPSLAMSMIATTSVSDVLTFSALVFSATVVSTLIRSNSVDRDVRRLTRSIPESEAAQIEPGSLHRVVQSHYRSGRGILIALMPATALVLALTVCSVIRDRGYPIFWMPLAVASGLTGLIAWLSQRVRDRLVMKSPGLRRGGTSS